MNIKGKNIGAAGNVNIKTQINLFGEQNSLPDTIPGITGFVGREDYLHELRETYEKGTRCFVLHGIGGVGKTALALRFADEIARDFEAKIFVSMQGMSKTPSSSRDAMLEIIRQFNPEIPPDIPDHRLKAVFTQFVQNQKTLIILDNAGNKQSVEALKTANACFITTSRESFILTGGKSFGIQKMITEDARKLLFEIAGEARFEGRADELAYLAGYLPMALKPLASILAEDALEEIAGLIERYRDKKELLKERVPDYDDLTIEASFELSYEKLPVEMQERWRRLAVFPADFNEPAIASVLGIIEDEAQKTQKELRRYSLLEVNTETKRFNLHDLARTFTNEKLSADERFHTQFLFSKYYARVLFYVQEMKSDESGDYYSKALNLLDTEWDNITTGQKWAAEFIEKDAAIANLCLDYSGYAPDFIILRLHPRRHIEWLELGCKAARKLDDHQAVGASLGNLGIAYFSLGEYRKAIEYHEQSLQISREIGNQRGEGQNLGNLGIAYDSLGEYRKAIEYHGQSLQISLEIGNRQGKSTSLGNLGNAYFSLGEYRKAIEYYEQALQISREIGDRKGEGNCLGNLGLAYLNLGEYRKAIEYHEQHLQISLEIGNRLGEGQSLGNLGSAYFSLGEYRKAIKYHEKYLQISGEIGDRQGEGNCLGNLGSDYFSLGDYRTAIDYYEPYLQISREIGDRLGEGISLGNLGSAYFSLGKYRKAIEYYEQALQISREIGDRKGEGDSLGNLGNAYNSLGEKEKACSLWKQALVILEAIESPTANVVRQWIEENC